MKRSGSDWWKLYHDDFWESEVVLLAEPDVAAVYLFLLGIQAKHGELPGDVRAVRALCSRFSDELWARAWAVLESCFPLTGDGSRANTRQASLLSEVDRERSLARARQRAARKERERGPLSRARHANVTPRRHADVTLERRGEERRGEIPSPPERGSAPVADAPAPQAEPVNGHATATASPPKPPRAVPDTPHHQTIDRWCKAYREAVGEDYVVQAKDAAAVKTMLRSHTPDRILEQAQRLLYCESAFHAEHRTLAWLSAKWNEIGQLAHANSLRLEGNGAKVVREAARAEASGQRPGILDWIENDEPKRLNGAH